MDRAAEMQNMQARFYTLLEQLPEQLPEVVDGQSVNERRQLGIITHLGCQAAKALARAAQGIDADAYPDVADALHQFARALDYYDRGVFDENV